jgi:genome maintenance exonuclease 1|tara:strand:+ start:125 stop:958 length:834 start_codon:yes stop_codon:yes gene_type:complete
MSDEDIKEYHNIGKEKKIKKSNKYNYLQGKQITDEESGNRVYDFNGSRLPSVTTVLNATKNQQFLKDWKAKVGEEAAERIKNLSSRRGTAMHKFLESYIEGVGYDDLTPIGCEAKPMATKIIEVGLTPVSEYYGSEVMLHYPGLYAGSTDLVCLHNDLETIVDFKQANRPKKEEWIQDYYLQIAAYAMAHDYVYKSEIKQGVVMVCTPDLYYQEFKVSGADLRSYKHKFLKRLDMYHELKFDTKENIIKQGDLESLLKEMQADVEVDPKESNEKRKT